MAVMEKCCCCSVRTACLIFGVLSLMGSISQIGKDGKEIIKTDGEREAEVEVTFEELKVMGVHIDKEEVRSIE